MKIAGHSANINLLLRTGGIRTSQEIKLDGTCMDCLRENTMQQSTELDRSDKAVVPLHPATEVGTVTLKVADPAHSLTFYTQVIGLGVFQQGEQGARLGVGKQPILTLEVVPGARP